MISTSPHIDFKSTFLITNDWLNDQILKIVVVGFVCVLVCLTLLPQAQIASSNF